MSLLRWGALSALTGAALLLPLSGCGTREGASTAGASGTDTAPGSVMWSLPTLNPVGQALSSLLRNTGVELDATRQAQIQEILIKATEQELMDWSAADRGHIELKAAIMAGKGDGEITPHAEAVVAALARIQETRIRALAEAVTAAGLPPAKDKGAEGMRRILPDFAWAQADFTLAEAAASLAQVKITGSEAALKAVEPQARAVDVARVKMDTARRVLFLRLATIDWSSKDAATSAMAHLPETLTAVTVAYNARVTFARAFLAALPEAARLKEVDALDLEALLGGRPSAMAQVTRLGSTGPVSSGGPGSPGGPMVTGGSPMFSGPPNGTGQGMGGGFTPMGGTPGQGGGFSQPPQGGVPGQGGGFSQPQQGGFPGQGGGIGQPQQGGFPEQGGGNGGGGGGRGQGRGQGGGFGGNGAQGTPPALPPPGAQGSSGQ